jgi:hypothetical protein
VNLCHNPPACFSPLSQSDRGFIFQKLVITRETNMKHLFKLLLSVSLGFLMVFGLAHFFQTNTAVAKAVPNQSKQIQAGLTYLQTQQQPDGGIIGFSGVSDPDTTARSVMAFITAGMTVTGGVSSEGNSMLDYLATQAITYTHDMTGTLFPGRTGILLAAVSLAGENPSAFGGMNLAGNLEASFQPATGTYSTTAHQGYSSGGASDLSQAWAILGLNLAGHTIPDSATQYLIQSQAGDGSWGSGDPDTTALAVTALLASRKVGSQSDTIQNAMKYFHKTQLPSGGWRPSWDTDPINADSTGWILQALVAAGESPKDQSWMIGQTNPVDALMSLQKPDGSIGGKYANTYSTAEAIIGLSEIPLSNLGVAPINHRAGLAIFWGDNTLFTTCVSFTESSLTGLDLLQRSGLVLETATNPNQGTAVCKIGQVGNSSNDCFGSMPNYWAYWSLGTNGWEYSVIGADQSQVMDGSVNAWSWGSGNSPALITFQNICEGVAYVLPTAAQTSVPQTDTPKPNPLATSIPATLPPQPTPTATLAQTGLGTYIVYASILLVLGALILYLIRFRNK